MLSLPAGGAPMQGYLAKKTLSPGTLKKAYALGPMVVLGWWPFLVIEVPP